MSEHSDPTTDTTSSLGPNFAYEMLAKYPQSFQPFCDTKKIGQGSFGKVFEARIAGGRFDTIPKVSVHYHHACLPIYQLKGYNHRLQTNSEKMRRQ